MYAALRADAHGVSREGQGDGTQIFDVDADGKQARDDAAVHHARRRVCVAARHDRLAGLERRAQRLTEFECELRRDFDVREAGDADGSEERARPLDAVDERHRYDRARAHRFIGPEFEVGAHDRARTENAARADGDAFTDLDVVLHDVFIGDRAPFDGARLAEVAVVPRRRTFDDGVARDDRIVADDGFRADARARFDDNVAAEHDGRDELRLRIDAAAFADPHARHHLGARDLAFESSVEGVLIGLLVLLQVADVGPVFGRNVAGDQLVLVQHARKDIARKIVRLARFHVIENLGLEHVNARVDGVGEDFAPARLLEKARDAAILVGDDDAEFERVGYALQRDRRRGFTRHVILDEFRKVEIGQRVARDDEERFVTDHIGREAYGAGGAEWRVLHDVAHLYAECRTVAEIALDFIR